MENIDKHNNYTPGLRGESIIELYIIYLQASGNEHQTHACTKEPPKF